MLHERPAPPLPAPRLLQTDRLTDDFELDLGVRVKSEPLSYLDGNRHLALRRDAHTQDPPGKSITSLTLTPWASRHNICKGNSFGRAEGAALDVTNVRSLHLLRTRRCRQAEVPSRRSPRPYPRGHPRHRRAPVRRARRGRRGRARPGTRDGDHRLQPLQPLPRQAGALRRRPRARSRADRRRGRGAGRPRARARACDARSADRAPGPPPAPRTPAPARAARGVARGPGAPRALDRLALPRGHRGGAQGGARRRLRGGAGPAPGRRPLRHDLRLLHQRHRAAPAGRLGRRPLFGARARRPAPLPRAGDHPAARAAPAARPTEAPWLTRSTAASPTRASPSCAPASGRASRDAAPGAPRRRATRSTTSRSRSAPSPPSTSTRTTRGRRA